MRILNIQRMSTEDGPGLRTTVFFKGCPLKCAWCHNPESISYQLDKEWIESSCILCLDCVNICPEGAIQFIDNQIVSDRNLCTMCKKCIDICPTNALKLIGKDITVDQLHKELIKDKAYFSHGGGITLSGGEVLIQTKEVLELLKLLKNDGIHIAIDTSGYIDFSRIQEISPYVDLFLYDLKLDSNEKHIEFCGTGNQLIKDNLIKLNKLATDIWIRTPIIPNSTDSKDNIESIARFLKDENIVFEKWELCAFNNLCKDKYKRLYINWQYENSGLIEKNKLEELQGIARAVFPHEEIYSVGATKLEVTNE